MEESSAGLGEMLTTVDRSGFLSGVMLGKVSLGIKSNVLDELFSKLCSTLCVGVQAVGFIKVTSAPTQSKWLIKPRPCARLLMQTIKKAGTFRAF